MSNLIVILCIILGVLTLNPIVIAIGLLLHILIEVSNKLDVVIRERRMDNRHYDLLNGILKQSQQNETHLSDTTELLVDLIEAQEKQIRILEALAQKDTVK